MGDRKELKGKAKHPEHQISMMASAIALRGVRLFLSVGRAAAEKRAAAAKPRRPKAKPTLPVNKLQQNVLDRLLKNTRFNKKKKWALNPDAHAAAKPRRPKAKPTLPVNKLQQNVLDRLLKNTRFNKNELEALHTMYRKLVTAAQAAIPTTGSFGQPVPKIDGIDQCTFRDVMHNTFDLVIEEAVLDRVWLTWERGPSGGEGALKFESWAHGLSVLLRGTEEERRAHCFAVYDLNGDGYITKDEMFTLLKNCLLKQPGDEDPDEGVRDLVELVLKKLDVDRDGKVSMDDYRQAVQKEPLLLEAFGQCLPTKRHAIAFMKTLSTK